MQLLRDICAIASTQHHVNDVVQMAVSALQTLDKLWVTLVDMFAMHSVHPTLQDR